MPTLEEMRKKFPMYDDIPDEQFTAALQNKGMVIDAPTGRPKWTENIWGAGEIDTPGEDIGAALGSGMEAGAAALVGLPGAIKNTALDGLDWAGIRDRPEGERAFGIPEAMAGMDKLTGDMGVGTGYQPNTRTGKFVKTAAEFVPGMVLPGSGLVSGGAKKVATNAILPGLASEAGGQLVEGSKAEPYMRAAGAILAPAGAAKIGQKMSGGKVSQAHLDSVKKLEAAGVRPTAGQTSNNPKILYAEDASQAGRAMLDDAAASYTTAVLDDIVPPSLKRDVPVTPGNTTQTFDQIMDGLGTVMDDLASKNMVPAGPNLLDGLEDIAKNYDGLASATAKTPYFRTMLEELKRSPVMDGKAYQRHRTALGELSKEGGTTTSAAVSAIRALDDAMEGAIKASGNVTDLARYRDVRKGYHKAKIVEKALGYAPGRGTDANITPASLGNASKTVSGYARGKSPFDGLVRAGEDVLKRTGSSGTDERNLARSVFGQLGDMLPNVPAMYAGSELGQNIMKGSMQVGDAAGRVASKPMGVGQGLLQGAFDTAMGLGKSVAKTPLPRVQGLMPGQGRFYNE